MIPQFKKLLSQALGKDKPHRYYDLNEEKEEGEENFVPNLGDQEGFVAEPARTDRSRLVTYVLAGILVCSHAAVWWYTRRTYSEWDINDPQSAFLAGIDRSLHMSRDNPFEAYNAFTASPEDFGDWAAERWWDIGAYGERYILDRKRLRRTISHTHTLSLFLLLLTFDSAHSDRARKVRRRLWFRQDQAFLCYF